MRVSRWTGERVYSFVNKHLDFIVALAIVGIICAIIGHYGQMGFNWWWFIFFEFPLYLFCGWALFQAYKMYKRICELKKKDIDYED